ncbi:MAG: hypothetical protein JWP91_4524 [Fibrobacteres bacterium]|nr:hypothetical protein [Fibrobacterota bacterium]
MPARKAIESIARFALIALAAIAFFAACGENNQMAGGTSSGVDNPELTVAFTDPSGAALRVTGDLDVYAQDQNPAVDPEPLVTVKIRNSSFTNITGDDFARIQTAAAKQAGTAQAKAGAVATAAWEPVYRTGDSSATRFNLILRTQDRTGSLALGFRYDSSAKAFSRAGGAIKRIDLRPRPLVRYTARVSREPIHGDGGRMFVPGTPFQATLVDSVFVIDDMPEGLFPLRLLAADGKVYPVTDSLNTSDSTLVYRPRTTSVGAVDTTHLHDSIPEFSVSAGTNHEAFLGQPSFLEANVAGIGSADSRLSFLWRLIKEAADSGRAGEPFFHDGFGPRYATIISPTRLRTEVRFSEEGVYQFEIAATIGLHTRMDTVIISVRRLPPPPPRIILPRPGDSLVPGRAYNIQWDMPYKGPVTVQVSVSNGAKWITLAQAYAGKDGLPILPWVPDRELAPSSQCLIQVISDADTTLRAGMSAPFNLILP